MVQDHAVPFVGGLHPPLPEGVGHRDDDPFLGVIQEIASLMEQAVQNGLPLQVGYFGLVQLFNIRRQGFPFPPTSRGAGIPPLTGFRLTLRFLPQHRLEGLLDELLQQGLVRGVDVQLQLGQDRLLAQVQFVLRVWAEQAGTALVPGDESF